MAATKYKNPTYNTTRSFSIVTVLLSRVNIYGHGLLHEMSIRNATKPLVTTQLQMPKNDYQFKKSLCWTVAADSAQQVRLLIAP